MEGQNAFKKIESNDKLPDHIKRETLGSLFSMKMLADFVDLFIVKAGNVLTSSIDGGEQVEKK